VINKNAAGVVKKIINDPPNTKTIKNMNQIIYRSRIKLPNSHKKIATHLAAIDQLSIKVHMTVKEKEATVELKNIIKLGCALNL